MINQLLKYCVPLLIIILFDVSKISGQEVEQTESPITIDLNDIENDGKRVEIQRYIGYENLLSRYLTLPYDISLNTSNQGRYFDIGFLLIIVFPLAILLLVYDNKKYFYSTLILIIIYLGISLSNSFINIGQRGAVYSSANNWTNVTSGEDMHVSESILVAIHNIFRVVIRPINMVLESISGASDHITYPILFLLMSLVLVALIHILNKNDKAITLSIITLVYFFLWLLLSGGIIWYGFLLIPMLFAFSFKIIGRGKKIVLERPLKILLVFSMSTWIILSYAARIGNIDYFTEEVNKGKGIVDSKLIYFSTGLHSARESQGLVYNKIGDTFDQINSNNDLIYQVGTSVTFNIKNNPQRVYQDNVLITFFDILNKYRDTKIIMDIFKASGYRYIIVDLYTPTLDKTPEKSLTNKYRLFLSSIYESKRVRLMSTDRIIEVASENREVRTINNVFVPDYNPSDKVNIKNHGSYAVYEIL